MHKGQKHIQMIAIKGASGAPAGDDLAAINAYTLREHTAEELYTRTMYLAHNGIDRDREVIDAALLADFVKTLPGKGLFVKHPMSYDGDTGPGEGRFYRAAIIEMSHDEARKVLREPNLMFIDEKALLLEASFYTVKTADNETLIKKVDAGVAGDVSIGFSSSDSTPIKDGADNIIARRLHAPGQAYEGSLVWLGAQPGARVFKQATLLDDEDSNMDYKIEFEKLQAKHAALETSSAANVTAATELQTLKAKIGDTDIDTLKANAELGKSYRSKMIDDVVAADRLAGLVEGDDEKTVTDAKAAYADWSVDRLQKYLARVNAMNTKGTQLGGGDPNGAGADAQHKTTGKDDTSNPLKNKAVTG